MFVWVLNMSLSRPVVEPQRVFYAKVFLRFQDKKEFSQEHHRRTVSMASKVHNKQLLLNIKKKKKKKKNGIEINKLIMGIYALA